MSKFVVLIVVWVGVAALARAGAAAEQEPQPLKLFRFVEKGKWGYMDGEGRVVIKPQYQSAADFADGQARVIMPESRAFINERGDIAFRVPRNWDWVHRFSEGRAAFSVGGKCGYLDLQYKVAIKPVYDDVEDFREGLAPVNLGAKVDETVIGLPRFGGKWGLIDRTGKEVAAPQWHYVAGFSDGVALIFGDPESITYINRTANIVLKLESGTENPSQFLHCGQSFSEGLAAISTQRGPDPQIGFINKAGEFAITPRYRWAGHFSEGLAAVSTGKRDGYIDRAGTIVIKLQFDVGGWFSEGVAPVRVGKSWGYIDRRGKFVIARGVKLTPERKPINHAHSFSRGLAIVHIGGTFPQDMNWPFGPAWQGGAWYYINHQGQIVRRLRLDSEATEMQTGRDFY